MHLNYIHVTLNHKYMVQLPYVLLCLKKSIQIYTFVKDRVFTGINVFRGFFFTGVQRPSAKAYESTDIVLYRKNDSVSETIIISPAASFLHNQSCFFNEFVIVPAACELF